MKTKQCLFVLSLFVVFQSCIWDHDDDDFLQQEPSDQFEPVFLSRNNIDATIKISDPKPILRSGKIYVKDNLLFVNEKREGFHVFDNSDPNNPIKLKFIEVPGSTDLAIRQNILYINQATDLIAARFNPTANSLSLTKRVENAFPELLSPNGFYAYDVPENSIVIDWKPKN